MADHMEDTSHAPAGSPAPIHYVGWVPQEELLITRRIEIDMGHRVTKHHSKCANVHGHRYTIEVALRGKLQEEGSQDGMILDFGFLKELMLEEIDAPCDHGLCLWVEDPLVETFSFSDAVPASWYRQVTGCVDTNGYAETLWQGGKLYVLNVVPTAENLAKHWFERLGPRIVARTGGLARVAEVKVWETANCSAVYRS